MFLRFSWVQRLLRQGGLELFCGLANDSISSSSSSLFCFFKVIFFCRALCGLNLASMSDDSSTTALSQSISGIFPLFLIRYSCEISFRTSKRCDCFSISTSCIVVASHRRCIGNSVRLSLIRFFHNFVVVEIFFPVLFRSSANSNPRLARASVINIFKLIICSHNI